MVAGRRWRRDRARARRRRAARGRPRGRRATRPDRRHDRIGEVRTVAEPGRRPRRQPLPRRRQLPAHRLQGRRGIRRLRAVAAHQRDGHRPGRLPDRAGSALVAQRVAPPRGVVRRRRCRRPRRLSAQRLGPSAGPADHRRRRVRGAGRRAARLRARARRGRAARPLARRAPRAGDPAARQRRLAGDPGQHQPAYRAADDRSRRVERRRRFARRSDDRAVATRPRLPSRRRGADVLPDRVRGIAGHVGRGRGGRAPRRVAPTGAGPGTHGAAELSLLVAALRAAAAGSGYPPAERPWLPPLPDRLARSTLPAPADGAGIAVARIDLPDEQRQPSLELDLAAGPSLLVAGAPRSGRTSVLLSVLTGAAERFGPDRLAVYVVDAAGALGPLVADVPHCATVLGPDELGSATTLLRRLERACGATSPAPATAGGAPPLLNLLLVDGWDSLIAGRPDVEALECADSLATLLRLGPAAALTIAVTGDRGVLAPRLATGFTQKIVLNLADRNDYGLVNISPRGLPVQSAARTGAARQRRRHASGGARRRLAGPDRRGPRAAGPRAVSAGRRTGPAPRRRPAASAAPARAPVRLAALGRARPARSGAGRRSRRARPHRLVHRRRPGTGGRSAPVGPQHRAAQPPHPGRRSRCAHRGRGRAAVPAAHAGRRARGPRRRPRRRRPRARAGAARADAAARRRLRRFRSTTPPAMRSPNGFATAPLPSRRSSRAEPTTSPRRTAGWVRRCGGPAADCCCVPARSTARSSACTCRGARHPGRPGAGVLVGDPAWGAVFADGDPLPVQVAQP